MLMGFVIGPGLQKLTAPSRLEFTARLIPKILGYVRGMIAGTFIFGLLLLYYITGGDFSMLSPSTTFGVMISTGMAIAVFTAVLAIVVIFPSFNSMASLAEGMLKSSGQPPPPDMMKYAKRAKVSSEVGSILLLVLVMMVSAGFY